MSAPRGGPQRGQARGAPPPRGVVRGSPYGRGAPRGARFQRAGWRGSPHRRGGARGAGRGLPPSPPPEEGSPSLREAARRLVGELRSREWWAQFWRRVPARRRCALCVGVRAGAWAAAALAAAGGAAGAALLGARVVHARDWAAVYAGRGALLAYLSALAGAAALLLLPAAAALAAGLARRSGALVEGALWAVAAHVAADWLATGCLAAYCLARPACLCAARCPADARGAAFLVTGSVLMLAYSAVWLHLLVVINSYKRTFFTSDIGTETSRRSTITKRRRGYR